jgi:hypothetical protein
VIIFISYLLLVFLVQTYHIFTLTCIFILVIIVAHLSTGPKGHVSFCHHLASAIVRLVLPFICLFCSQHVIYLFVLLLISQNVQNKNVCMWCYLYSIGNQQKKLDLLSSFSLLVKFLTVLVHVLKKDLFI